MVAMAHLRCLLVFFCLRCFFFGVFGLFFFVFGLGLRIFLKLVRPLRGICLWVYPGRKVSRKVAVIFFLLEVSTNG